LWRWLHTIHKNFTFETSKKS